MLSPALARGDASASKTEKMWPRTICCSSELVRAVRAQAQDVLDEELVVGEVGREPGARGLQAQAAEFRRAPVDHRGRALGMEAHVESTRAEPVVAQAHAPQRHELIRA